MTKTEALKIIAKYEAWTGTDLRLRSGHTLRTATREELDELIAVATKEAGNAQAALDEAIKYRPSYAPAARPTRTESGRHAVLAAATERLDALRASRLLVINNIERS